ncbi:AraC family transcriptional regulator [Catenuloplanes atrovinosus]|uniref:AraC-like DNA-binding protein n=1 Tax=Catenuloplanes atrovinosus TaxID=137266 RepID=A0AAE3YTQ6_9ACTN|nr:AraC family transcriptional regulator [Catenuloplanes atrovinosus]MDR7278470.1 AraC-like DNA-binding protein [Catenuloplanes atrovinosus]
MDVISEAIDDLRIGRVYGRRAQVPATFAGRFEACEGVGFHVLLRGTGWLITESDPPARMRAGDIALVPHGAAHGFAPEPRALAALPPAPMGLQNPPPAPMPVDMMCGIYRLEHGGGIHRFLRSLPDAVLVSPDYAREARLGALIELLTDDLDTPRDGHLVTRPALVDLMLVHALRLWQARQGAAGPAWDALGDPAIAAALREIHDSPQAPWTVERLSRAAGMSRTAFTRRFTSLVGTPPMTYLIGRRLHQGAQLLRETDAPLAAIARQVGYATEFAFAGAFRREFGISPGRFRRVSEPLPG